MFYSFSNCITVFTIFKYAEIAAAVKIKSLETKLQSFNISGIEIYFLWEHANH
jgi:hypothetical protein